ncbi:MAG: M28 family peptidase [Psychroflexus sp.]|nr:M28 family peptidase [Psychroflexus sp.]MDN6309510.1 M28 family peptidase [Psychroflexus sp.]
MKKITLLCVLLFGILACNSQKQGEKTQASEPTEKHHSLLAKKDPYDLTTTLKYLTSNELKGRDVGSKGLDLAADYIEEVFEKNAIKPFFDKRSYRNYFSVKSEKTSNVVGYIPGERSDLAPLIIGAHYDHIGVVDPVGKDSIANGANDNASGTAAVLELAKFFSHKKLKRDVIFALFSGEEKGLLGSQNFSKYLSKNEIEPYAVFNIEMIGVPMKDKDYLAYITGFENSTFTEVFNSYTGKKTLGFLPEAQEMKLFQRSDNYPFYETFHIPAHTICTFDFTNFDYYHHVSDEFSEIDVEHIQNVVKEIQPGLLGIAKSTKNNIQLKE